MSKLSREKQKEIEAKQKGINRRKAIKGIIALGGLTIAGAGAYNLYDFIRNPSFVEAFDNPSKREKWLNSLENRAYVDKKITTQEDLIQLKRKLDYSPPKDAFAATIAEQEEMIGRGSKSTLYVYDTCFNKDYSTFKEGLGIVVENVINNHELIHSDHYFSGIPGYPIGLFKKSNRSFNVPLFMSISEIIAHKREYDKLITGKHDNEFVILYQSKIKDLVKPYFQLIQALTNNSKILKKVEKERWF